MIMIISDNRNHLILATERRYILSTCWRKIVTTQLCQYPLSGYISYLNIQSLTLLSDIIANYDVCLFT